MAGACTCLAMIILQIIYFFAVESNCEYSENFMSAKISRPRVGSGTNTATSEVHYLSLRLLPTPQGFSSLTHH